MKQPSVNIKNKRATFDYELMDTYTAGIVLTGTEIKSIRLGKASLVDTFCYFAKGEGMKDPGFTTVPVRLFINEKGLAKLVVALAKGKKQYDKRESIKEKDDRRDMARMFKR